MGFRLSACESQLNEEAPADADALGDALLASHAGIFEVTASDPAGTLWLRDFLGLGEYPVDEPHAAAELTAGDLVVGRLYPLGESVFGLSPAAEYFRNAGLREALERDLETLRSGRRGSLRIAQQELERMFFGPHEVPAQKAPGDDAAERLAAARERLLALGLAGERVVDHWIGQLGRAADGSRVAGASALATPWATRLDQLAMDSDVDLGAARVSPDRGLAGRQRSATGRRRGQEAARSEQPTLTPTASPAQVQAALQAYDAARASGADISSTFAALEKSLGLRPRPAGRRGLSRATRWTKLIKRTSADSAPPAEAHRNQSKARPTCPESSRRLVEEYLWELSQNGEDERAEDRTGTPGTPFVEYAADVQELEQLNGTYWLGFLGLWLVDREEYC